MNLELISQILEVCIVPLLGLLTKFLIDYLTAKRDQIKAGTDSAKAKKYTDMIYNTVVNCVQATNQTYVEALKKENAFTKEAQEEAFNKTMDAVMTILTDDAKEYVSSIAGDLNTYLTQLIEAEVNNNK